MQSFKELYETLTRAALQNHLEETIRHLESGNYNPYHLDCLLHPEKHPLMINTDDDATLSDEVNVDENTMQVLTDAKEALPMFHELCNRNHPVYAMIAPAFIGQFSHEVTPGRLRTAFKKLGFAGMVEVALFADILTLKEALEFDRSVQKEEDYILTSCCCPVWLNMCRKAGLMEHIPGSVSPMVACGRSIKQLHPHAVTVFIGPCIAKKAEAKEPDICDAVDYVLTFQEIREIFDLASIDPATLEEDEREHSSTAGRIYAFSGGVSRAVQSCLYKIRPERTLPLTVRGANGVSECRALIEDVKNGKHGANFIEGMGCVGGCVGGPKALLSSTLGQAHVARYGDQADYASPAENPYVIDLLHRLGFTTFESLLDENSIFARHF
ncbi:MAG: iron hydrogenase [Ruminococcaceae bacterium]|nr:iron hydrogenase [Oscillospiraceae bacterium]